MVKTVIMDKGWAKELRDYAKHAAKITEEAKKAKETTKETVKKTKTK